MWVGVEVRCSGPGEGKGQGFFPGQQGSPELVPGRQEKEVSHRRYLRPETACGEDRAQHPGRGTRDRALSPKRKLECLRDKILGMSQTLRHLSAVLGAAGPLKVSERVAVGSSGGREERPAWAWGRLLRGGVGGGGGLKCGSAF